MERTGFGKIKNERETDSFFFPIIKKDSMSFMIKFLSPKEFAGQISPEWLGWLLSP